MGELFAHAEYGRIVRSITGRTTAAEVAERAREITESLAGAGPRELLFASVSVGAVFGWQLADGERAVLKWHAPGAALDALEAQYAIMDALAGAGVPCPRRIAGPVETGPTRPGAEHSGAAVLLSWLPAANASVDLDRRRQASAEMLARVIGEASALEAGRALPPHEPLAQPWPTPHAVVFDFEATREGAEGIDAIGRWTADALGDAPADVVVTHCDWTAHNVILGEDAQVVAVYDWDSLERSSEAVTVGAAAVAFALDGRTGGDFRPPEPASTLAFLDAYRSASGRLDADGLRRAKIAAVRTFGYLARCQHAIATARGHDPYPFVRRLDAYRRAILPEVDLDPWTRE